MALRINRFASYEKGYKVMIRCDDEDVQATFISCPDSKTVRVWHYFLNYLDDEYIDVDVKDVLF